MNTSRTFIWDWQEHLFFSLINIASGLRRVAHEYRREGDLTGFSRLMTEAREKIERAKKVG